MFFLGITEGQLVRVTTAARVFFQKKSGRRSEPKRCPALNDLSFKTLTRSRHSLDLANKMATAANSDAPARDSPVTAETARFPQYIRAGFRPMLHAHEDFLVAAFAEKPVAREFREILDKSLGAFVFSRNTEGEVVVALVEERPSKGSP